MKMIPGTGTISNYSSYVSNCVKKQWPYKIPVNSLDDVQLYIDIGESAPGSVQYEIIHTCGATGGTIEAITPTNYVVAQDTNSNWYGVFKNFTGAAASCFVIAITLDSQIYFSEEYCIDNTCSDLTLLKGCYGTLDNLLSYDCNDIYFGTPFAGAIGDSTVKYEHQLLIRSVELSLSAFKNTFKQGFTRNFRTEKERIYQFFAEFVPEWYITEIDAVFTRGEVYVGSTKYLVNETSFEKIEDCLRTWKPTATFKESKFQSFSCEDDPCGSAAEESGEVTPCCSPVIISADVVYSDGTNTVTVAFNACSPTPQNGYRVLYRIKGTADSYTDAGNVTSSPATIIIEGDPEGTDYEGYITSDCSESGIDNFGTPVYWQTASAPVCLNYTVTNNHPDNAVFAYITCAGITTPVFMTPGQVVVVCAQTDQVFVDAGFDVVAGSEC